MNKRQQRTYVVMAVAIALWGGVFAAFAFIPGLTDIFKSDGSSGYSVSAARLSEIVGEIRKHTREKWLERLDELDVAVGKMQDFRDEHFDDIAARRDPAYLEELKRLSENHHQGTEARDLRPEDVSLETVFEAIKDSEKRLTNYYRDVVAAKNALKMEVPAIDAVSWVKVVPPKRIELDKQALDQDVRSREDGSLEAFKDNVNIGSSEIDAMLKYAEKMMKKAGIDGGEGSMEGWQQISDSAFGSTQGETLLPDELSLDDEGTSEGGFGAVPGRYIGGKGAANKNIYINKWYVLGPFENRFRSNLDASFIPESVIDLESTTLGKDDREISWEYWNMGKQRIEPTWAPRGAVYYGWTEVYVEEAGKYWISTGSDDYGKMWINGELVWKSDTRAKSYRADEHTAEYEFKQGVNQILFRCENNGGTMGWSVIFHLAQE